MPLGVILIVLTQLLLGCVLVLDLTHGSPRKLNLSSPVVFPDILFLCAHQSYMKCCVTAAVIPIIPAPQLPNKPGYLVWDSVAHRHQ